VLTQRQSNRQIPREKAENKGVEFMSESNDKTKEQIHAKIDAAADAAKRATDIMVDKSKDVAHSAGKKLEREGKRLQSV